MELIADNSNADSNPREYVIDRDELLHLRDSGLIQPKLFVYLAIKLTYDHERTIYRHPCVLRAMAVKRRRIFYGDRSAPEEESSATSGSSANASIVLSS